MQSRGPVLVFAIALAWAHPVPTIAALSVADLNSGTTPAAMTNALLGPTSGITVSNISYTGAPNGAGLFAGGTGIIGFDSGIVLSSGAAAGVIGPNSTPKKMTLLLAAGSPLLDALVAPNLSTDASVLSFDFIPDSSFVYLQFVFSSDEYNNFVGTEYGDVFGAFVNGVNRALIPGSSQNRIAVDTVNCGFAVGGGGAPGIGPNCCAFIDNPFVSPTRNTEMDGLTTVVTLVAPVNANVTNTMVLAIADVGLPPHPSQFWDSAVFIKAGSFTTSSGAAEPDRRCYICGDPLSIKLSELGARGTVTIRELNGGVVVDSEALHSADFALVSPGVYSATLLSIDTTAPDPGNGAVDCRNGNSLEISYLDPNGSGSSTCAKFDSTCVSMSVNGYCISGLANGSSYSWWIDRNKDGLHISTEPNQLTAPGVPAGSDATQLASAFATTINTVVPGTSGATQNCFTIVDTPPFALRVGASGISPACVVTSDGCTYNPVITLGENLSTGGGETGGTQVPALGARGLAFEVVLLIAAVYLVLRRKPVA